MFFYIGKNCNLLNEVSEGLFLDKGWTFTVLGDKQVWYKGYSTECRLHDSLHQILEGYQPRGIWCVISDKKIYHSVLGGFEVYNINGELTNLKLVNMAPTKYRDIYPLYSSITLDKVVDEVKEILFENFLRFIQYNEYDMNIWVTGGIDSTLLIAICEYLQIPYNLYASKYYRDKFEGNIFLDYESPLIQFIRDTHKGYNTLSVFEKPTCVVTGFYGDPIFCREIHQLSTLANASNKSLRDILKPSDYVYSYVHFINKTNTHITDYVENISPDIAKKKIALLSRDQVCHIDNTITFCPYYDERIMQVVLSLGIDDLTKFGINATIQKELIEKLYPDLALWLNDQKNTGIDRVNFFINYDKVKLNYCKSLHKL